jgi:hypothetical protein
MTSLNFRLDLVMKAASKSAKATNSKKKKRNIDLPRGAELEVLVEHVQQYGDVLHVLVGRIGEEEAQPLVDAPQKHV